MTAFLAKRLCSSEYHTQSYEQKYSVQCIHMASLYCVCMYLGNILEQGSHRDYLPSLVY